MRRLLILLINSLSLHFHQLTPSSSDLRQIPDHQEVFLSPTTLTSVIFEINDYVEQPTDSFRPTTTTTTTTQADGTTSTTTTTAVNGSSNHADPESDLEAAKYHFRDVVSAPDRLAAPLPDAQGIRLPNPSVAGFRASILSGNIISQDTSRRGQHALPPPQAPSSASSSRSSLQSLVHQIQLLARMEDYDTDMCVRINVPLKELAEDEREVVAEVAYARDVLARIVATLEIRDFGLFGVEG